MPGIRKEINVYTRWESSRKSLFVKTVWVEGRRHVILFDEDPILEYFKFTSRSSRVSSCASKNSDANILSPTVFDDFRVPSVKLLLAEISKYKKASRTKKLLHKSLSSDIAKTLCVQVIPNNTVKFQNINEGVVSMREKQCDDYNLLKAFKFSRVSSSFETKQELINENEYADNNYDLLIPHLNNENRSNSLSDRVLSWLDLAVQSGEISQKCVDMPEKLKVDYRELLNQKSKTTVNHRSANFITAPNRSRSCDYQDQKFLEEWAKGRQHSLKTAEISRFSTMNVSNIENIVDQNRDIIRITSYREHLSLLPKCPLERCRTDILKRQLHVFIPHIPKKNDDSSSISSKSSSMLKMSSL